MVRRMQSVQIVDRPGYFGKKRAEYVERYNREYPNGWAECWQVNGWIYSFLEAVTLYDDAYHAWLTANPNLTTWVCTFSECFDHDESNIEAGCDHDTLSLPRHIQDVSVRRSLVRQGKWFGGSGLLQIRGEETNGHQLMPGLVPFHMPHLILPEGMGGPTRPWMKEGSVEMFWQRNKVIIVK